MLRMRMCYHRPVPLTPRALVCDPWVYVSRYVFFDVIVNGPNPLGSWNTPWLVREYAARLVCSPQTSRR
mgnify:FL=1